MYIYVCKDAEMPPCSSSFTTDQTQTLTLIPNLPNDVAALILAHIPFSHHSRLKPTSKLWRSFFSHKTLISFRRLHLPPSSLSHLLCIFPQDPSISPPYLFDPQNLAWSQIPPMPCNPHVYGLCNFSAVSIRDSIFIIGGSLFDTRSFPIDRPISSPSGFRFDFSDFKWGKIADMLSPRGSFACAAVPGSAGRVVVAGGGSRHTMFGAAGTRMESAEVYDVERDEWEAVEGLPRFRAGCVGFFVGGEERERGFWVMGGYGESRTVSGVFPVDEYYRDALVMEMEESGGGRWREVGDMWEGGERRRLGKIVVVDDEEGGGGSGVFMLDGGDVLRYDMASNHWWKETSIPRDALDDSSVGFVALDGDLYVMTLLNAFDITDNTRRSRHNKKAASMFIQIYNIKNKVWSSLISKPPLHHHMDFRTAVMCTIRL